MDWPESLDDAPLGDGKRATVHDRPHSVAELREIVVRRAAEGLAIYPQGGRTALDYGGIPRRPGVALDISALNTVVDYPAADMTVTICAGITLSKLQAVLDTEGQFLPLDAPFPAVATLGGIYATNSGGPRRFGWGRPRDLIIGVSFVTADGREIKGGGRVVKNVAGYDFPKLLTGSMGTLGIITQMTLKTRPKPGASALVTVSFSEPGELVTAVASLNTSATRPVAIEVLNRLGSQAITPCIGKGPWQVVVGFEDNLSSVDWQVERLIAEWNRSRSDCAIFDGVNSHDLWQSLTGFAALDTGGPVSITASLPRSKALTFALGLDSEIWSVKVQPASGIVVAHSALDLPEEIAVAAISELRSQVVAAAGGLVVSRCPTAWKDRIQVWGERRGDWAIMERIKAALDPAEVLNPGRFVGTI